ncbi:ATP-dependent RNA helicase dhx29 [Dissostichus eleginoides]|uniref:RNA helicase n=1 Tax=Dissostichus eleginoides TaxID=100907 RepID=A0AAD9F0X4_DISEL|nr:ATP-dependent RNA helicase dhx29 [Dissostichus eleginoides]
MGGKKKKSAAGVAAPLAPAAAASAGRSEATAAEKQGASNKPAKPIKENKKAPKTYSLANTAQVDTGGVADKSILKVVIQPDLEKKIIKLINDFREENGDKGPVSGRLTNKKLLKFSFKREHIEESMKSSVLYGGDLHSALDWLCLNLKDDELPEGFTQQMQEESQKSSRPKFQPPAPEISAPPSPKAPSIEKFDPNDRYLLLTAQLYDARDMAAVAKTKGDKTSQRSAQDRIRIILQEISSWSPTPCPNPALKVVDAPQKEKKTLPVTEDLAFSVFEQTEKAPPKEKAPVVKKNEPKDIRDFDYTARSWTGKSPNVPHRLGPEEPPQEPGTRLPQGACWEILERTEDILEVCPTILTEDSMQAQHLAATLALYTMVKGQSVHQLLPPTYRDVWLEDQFISRLLTRLKQQQNQDQGPEAGSEGPEKRGRKEGALEAARELLMKLRKSPLAQKLKHRHRVLEALQRHPVVVVAGETGSGKSTQIPQFLLEELLIGCPAARPVNIVVTQPRRISAMSLACRVNQEQGCEDAPGSKSSLCGYQIRMENRSAEGTRLLYCTTGVLLRKLQHDSHLSSLTHIIVDEVHERSVQSDFLLTILKDVVMKRSDLKLILMSATVDCQKFSSYFNRCPVISIPGRTFPVEVSHLEDIVEETGYLLEKDSEYTQKILEDEEEVNISFSQKGGKTSQHQGREFILSPSSGWDLGPDLDHFSSRTRQVLQYMNPNKINMDLLVDLIAYLDKSPQFAEMDGAVLVFLPGLAHIQQLFDLLTSDKRFRDKNRFKIVALHSTLSSKDQAAAFTVPPAGVRKIVLSTNIAETGVTIPDVVFVIDTGKTKENKYHESSQMSSLVETFVSKASALQRQGRAGRVRSGFCFRLYPKFRFDSFMDYSIPEILRKCQYGSPEEFLSRALDPPQPQSVCNAIGKMLIYGAILGCLEPIATIAAAISEKSPFSTPMNRKEEANLAKAALAVSNSDHLTIYNAYLGWKTSQSDGQRAETSYCRKHFLNRTALITIEGVQQELMRMMEQVGFYSPRSRLQAPALSKPQISVLNAVLAAGLYDSVARVLVIPSVDVLERAVCNTETPQGRAQVHPSSVNRNLQTHGWLLYQEKVKYTKIYLRDTTLIPPFPLLLFGGDIDIQHRERLITLDGWIHFQAPVRIGVIFKHLRKLMDSLLEKKLENPRMNLEGERTIQMILDLIQSE